MSGREFDIVLYGAAGFTGRQTVEYLARHADGRRVRWALAGRDRARLELARAAAGAGAERADIILADSRDPASVDAMIARTRVVCTTAGPFARYGTPVVDACVRHRTHYCDITGETQWVRGLIAQHHDRAAGEGTRIVPFCGFDSVPSDLGAFLVARQLAARGTPCAEVRGYFRMRGGLNGGTVATAMAGTSDAGGAAWNDAFLLDPPGPHSPLQLQRSRQRARPRFDDAIGAWTGPFVMAPTNTRVVRRSAALYAAWGAPYGPDFGYREWARYGPPLAPLKAMAATGALGLFAAALARPALHPLLGTMLPKPGEGPSAQVMDRGGFTCDLVGIGEDGSRLTGRIRHTGDPGNRATVRFLCESALALALDGDALPGGPSRGGVLTPATALGDVLADRLRRAGVAIEIGAAAPRG